MTTRNARIRERLETLKLSERAASLKAGLNARFLTDLLLNPDMSPRAENLRKLAAALETTPDWIDRGIDTRQIDDTTAELLTIMPKLSARARRRLLENAKTEAKLSDEAK
jgi:hypothetical protein